MQVWSVREDEADWGAMIDEGLAGLTGCLWAPDGRHILTFTDFHVRLSRLFVLALTRWKLCLRFLAVTNHHFLADTSHYVQY